MPGPFWTYSQHGSMIVFPLGPSSNTIGIGYITIDNGTAAIISLNDPSGAPYAYVPAYQSRQFPVPDWLSFTVSNFTGAVLQATDILVIQAFQDTRSGSSGSYPFPDSLPPLTPSSYGPAAWGGGSVPPALTDVNPGDQFFAWQVEQCVQALRGSSALANWRAGSGTTNAGSLLAVTFSTPFVTTPAVTATINQPSTSVTIVAQNITVNGFSVQAIDSTGTAIARSFSWIAMLPN